MMLDARRDYLRYEAWMESGGDTTLASYVPRKARGRLSDVPEAHWEFLERCVPAHETESHLFVHATLHPRLALAEQPPYLLRWEKIAFHSPHASGKTMVCGHTRQRSGVPRDWGHAICIDTAASSGGWLTCLDVGRRWIWQADERGRKRDGALDEVARRR